MPEWKDLLAALATLVASFAGAWAAFAFEARRKRREEEQRNIGAANRAIYTLYHFWNVLEQYRKEALELVRGRADAWLNLPAHPAPLNVVHSFSSGELQFLLQTSKAEVFAALMLEEQRFSLALDLIKKRSELVLEKVFPLMSQAGIGVGLFPEDL